MLMHGKKIHWLRSLTGHLALMFPIEWIIRALHLGESDLMAVVTQGILLRLKVALVNVVNNMNQIKFGS